MLSVVTATARRFLRPEYLPEAVLLAGLTVFFLDEPSAATSAFKSTKAVVIMAAVTIGWLAARLVLGRLRRFAVGRAAVFSVAAAVALAVVVFPAYDDKTVVETFPTAAAVSAPPVPVTAPTTSTTSASAAAPQASTAATAPRPTTTTTTAMAAVPVAASRSTTTTAPTSSEQDGTASAEPGPTTPVPAGPQKLRSGAIRGIDHRASGTATIYRQPDGRFVVGLEDIDIQPGPDYDLYIVPGDDREDTRGGTRLGDLKGNKGTQYYEVPVGLDLENGPWSVLVWCQTFAVPVAGATPG